VAPEGASAGLSGGISAFFAWHLSFGPSLRFVVAPTSAQSMTAAGPLKWGASSALERGADYERRRTSP
jgi:hypothetical protein